MTKNPHIRKRFAFKSSITGKGMNSGYIFHAYEFYCEDEVEAVDKAIELGYASLLDAHFDKAYVFVEWQAIEINRSYYDDAGNKYNSDGTLSFVNLFSAQGSQLPET